MQITREDVKTKLKELEDALDQFNWALHDYGALDRGTLAKMDCIQLILEHIKSHY